MSAAGERWADSFVRLDDPDTFGLAVGDRVELDGGHPHAGKTGTVDGVEELALLGGQRRPRVKLDAGGGCFIMRASQFRRLDAPKPKRPRRRR